MNKTEIRVLWEKVKAENAAKAACLLHRFDKPESFRLGQKYQCLSCGGNMDISSISLYAQGYTAAGGDADVIMQGLNESKGDLSK